MKKMLYVLGVTLLLVLAWKVLLQGTSEFKYLFRKPVAEVKAAAEQGEAEAQYYLGERYVMGYGVRQDYDEALKWYEKAAKQGFALAQFELGLIYNEGKGVQQNKWTAKEWFGKACDNGLRQGCDEYRKLSEAGF